jgi:hypothetical protein
MHAAEFARPAGGFAQQIGEDAGDAAVDRLKQLMLAVG